METVQTYYIKPFSSEVVVTGASVTSEFFDCKQFFTSLAVHLKEMDANAVTGSVLIESSEDGVNVDGSMEISINTVDTLSQLIPTYGRYYRFTISNDGSTDITATVKAVLKDM